MIRNNDYSKSFGQIIGCSLALIANIKLTSDRLSCQVFARSLMWAYPGSMDRWLSRLPAIVAKCVGRGDGERRASSLVAVHTPGSEPFEEMAEAVAAAEGVFDAAAPLGCSNGCAVRARPRWYW